MSLSSLLDSPAGRRAAACIGRLRPHLTVESPRGLNWGHDPLIPPARPNESRYITVVGTGWDYWARLWLLRQHGVRQEGELVAEAAVELLRVVGAARGVGGGSRECSRAGEAVAQAIERRRAVLAGNLSPLAAEVIRDCIVLGSLDPVWRAGFMMWEQPPAGLTHQATAEMKALAEVFIEHPERLGSQDKPIWANPEFGKASSLVRGADADVVIGNTLWELKTTTRLHYLRQHWAQLAGYYVLSVLGRSAFSLQRVGVYFARFGTQTYIDIADLERNADLDGFARGLIQAATRGRGVGRGGRDSSRWLDLWQSRAAAHL